MLLASHLSVPAMATEGKRDFPVEPPTSEEAAALALRPAPPKAIEGMSRLGVAPSFEYVHHLPRDYHDYGFRPALVALHPPRGCARAEYELWRPLLLERPYAFAALQGWNRIDRYGMDGVDAARAATILFELHHFAGADTAAALLVAPLSALPLAADILRAAPEFGYVALHVPPGGGEERDEAKRAFDFLASSGLGGEGFAPFAGRTALVYAPGPVGDRATLEGALVAQLAALGATVVTPASPGAPPAMLAPRAWLLAAFERAAGQAR